MAGRFALVGTILPALVLSAQLKARAIDTRQTCPTECADCVSASTPRYSIIRANVRFQCDPYSVESCYETLEGPNKGDFGCYVIPPGEVVSTQYLSASGYSSYYGAQSSDYYGGYSSSAYGGSYPSSYPAESSNGYYSSDSGYSSDAGSYSSASEWNPYTTSANPTPSSNGGSSAAGEPYNPPTQTSLVAGGGPSASASAPAGTGAGDSNGVAWWNVNFVLGLIGLAVWV
jgi:hypothetical protein